MVVAAAVVGASPPNKLHSVWSFVIPENVLKTVVHYKQWSKLHFLWFSWNILCVGEWAVWPKMLKLNWNLNKSWCGHKNQFKPIKMAFSRITQILLNKLPWLCTKTLLTERVSAKQLAATQWRTQFKHPRTGKIVVEKWYYFRSFYF